MQNEKNLKNKTKRSKLENSKRAKKIHQPDGRKTLKNSPILRHKVGRQSKEIGKPECEMNSKEFISSIYTPDYLSVQSS